MKELFVDTPDQLIRLCDELKSHRVIALDTEFMREKTYYAQLCLLQVACDDFLACVDPLALPSLDPFLAVLYDPDITIVMHSARQDLELFYDLTQRIPAAVFDTQIAATLLGYGDQLGYASLIEKMLGVKLAKSHTRTDWSRRPLAKGQIEYALDDVRYLLEVYRIQTESLNKAGRADWLDADFAALCNIKLYQQPEEDLWQKVRGANTLRGVQLAALQLLAQWREHQAINSNRPRRWIVRDDVLLQIARQMPQTDAALNEIRGLEGILQKHSRTLLALVQKAKSLPPEQRPQPVKRRGLSTQQEAQVDLLMAVVRTRAEQSQVTPAVLASRKDLECLVQGKSRCAVLSGWRASLVGDELRAIINGERIIQFDNGKLEINTVPSP